MAFCASSWLSEIQAESATSAGASQYPGVWSMSSSVEVWMLSSRMTPRSVACRMPVAVRRTTS